MDVNIIARGSPNDDFFYPLFEECLKYIPDNSLVYYVWANPLDRLENMLATLNFNSPNVFLFIPDDLTDRCFIPNISSKSYISILLSNILKNHPNTNFVVVTDVANLSAELTEFTNIKLINSEFCALNQFEYQSIPLIKKDLSSTSSFITFAGSPSRSRTTLLSYLYDQQLEGTILVGKALANDLSAYTNYLDMINWPFSPTHETTVKPNILNGFNILKSKQQDSQGFGMSGIHKNYENLDRNLRQYYQTSFVEIVCETYYEEPSFMITEKTLHNIYGQCFPLIVSSVGTVDYLEQLGIDMFRDVVDHSYDHVVDPIDRIVKLVDDNRRLLVDTEYSKQLWCSCKHRFLNNINFVQTQLHNQVRQRVITQL